MFESVKGYGGGFNIPYLYETVLGRTQMINDTKIKYIKIDDVDKLYQVEKISFYDFSIKAVETDLKIGDVPEEEIFDISDFKEFRVTLKNTSVSKIVEFMRK